MQHRTNCANQGGSCGGRILIFEIGGAKANCSNKLPKVNKKHFENIFLLG